MSWWSDAAPPAAARVLRGPRVSATRPASLLVDPEMLRVHQAPRHNGNETVNGSEPEQSGPLPTADPAQQAADLDELALRIKTARAEGYEEGHRIGLTEGRAAAEAQFAEANRVVEERREGEIASAAGALLAAVQRVEEAREEAVSVAETECAELAFKLTKALVGRESQLSESPTVDSIVRALALAPTNEAVVVRLNPDDITTLSGFDMSSLGRECTVIADESVEQTGCIVEVGATRIDAQLGRALGRVRKVLLGMGHHHDHHDTDADHGNRRTRSNGVHAELSQMAGSQRSGPVLVGTEASQ